MVIACAWWFWKNGARTWDVSFYINYVKFEKENRCNYPGPMVLAKTHGPMWAALEIYYQNSYQSRFSGVYLVFEVFQDTWHSKKENPSVCWYATLPCPLIASNYATSDLVLDADNCLDFLGIQGAWGNAVSFLSRFTGVYLVLLDTV